MITSRIASLLSGFTRAIRLVLACGLIVLADPAPAAPVPDASESTDTVAVEPLRAQSDPAHTNEDEPPAAIETIVVTAQKRAQSIQDVPVSIAAFTGGQLDARGIVEVRDLGQLVPGLQFTDLAGYNLIYLRGVGTDAFIPAADPSVSTYLDGVYFPSAHSIAQSFGALERVEVLKGPQGTLFGRNSTGGAVNIWTRPPDRDGVLSVQAGYGRFDDLKTRVHANLPLGDAFAMSLSAFYNRADNYYRLENASGDELPEEIGKGARVRLGFHPDDELQIVLTGLLMRHSGTSTTASANTRPSPILGAAITPETREYVVTANTTPSLTTDTRAAYGELVWSKPWFDTKLLGSYYWVDAYDYVYDFDASSRPMATYGADSDFQRFVTGELQLTSNDSTWGADWLDWVGGFYYLRSTGGYDPGYLRLFDSLNLPIGDVVAQLPAQLRDPLLDLLGGAPIPSTLTFYFTGLIGAESYSGYAQGTAHLTDRIDLTAGARYQHETRELIRSNVATENLAGGTSPLVPWAPRASSVDNLSPRVSLDLRPADGLLLYASYQQGFKSATYNIINIYQQPDYVKPEKVGAYELGVKSDLLDGDLRFNAAVFQNDIDNLQTGFVSFTSGGAINFENAGRARIRGVEFDSIWAPLPSSIPGLRLTASATWMDARYTEYLNGSGYDEDTGLAFSNDNGTGRDFSGNRIVRTPEWAGTLGVSQTFDTDDGPLEIGADWYYNDGYYYLAQNSPSSYEGAYDVLGARISYLYEAWGVQITAFGHNLTDERYNLAQFHTDFGREDTLAPPLTYGVRLNWDLES